MAGVDSTGLTIKTQAEILAEINTDQQSDLGADWDVSETSPEGVMNGIISVQLAEIWELLPLLVNNFYSDTAEGVYLDRNRELTGATRLTAEPSIVSIVCIGTNATALPLGRVVSVANGGPRYASTEAATIATLTAWAISTAYVVGDLRTNDSGKIYSCTAAGTSAGAGGPTGTSTSIMDGTVTWRYVGAGTAAVAVPFESEEDGEIVGNAGTITTIETSVGGWSSAVNPLDAALGRNEETDAEFRDRSADLLTVQGAGPVDAIRADLLGVEDVTSVTVFENDTDVENGDGLPPHSIEAVILGGDDQDIIDALLTTKAAGIETYGNTSGVATDSSDVDHTLYFTRPTELTTYVTVDVTVLEDSFPSDGADQIKEAIVAYGATLGTGDDVVRSQLFKPVDDISGVYDITNIKLGFTITPAGTVNLTVGIRELATFDSSRVVVNVTTL